MKWTRKRNGSWELREGDMLHAVMEPARTRGHWWWTTWGMRPDSGGYAFSREEARRAVEEVTRAR